MGWCDVQLQIVVAICWIRTLTTKLVLHPHSVMDSLYVLFQAGPGEKCLLALVTVVFPFRFPTSSSTQVKMELFESFPTDITSLFHVSHVLSFEVISHDCSYSCCKVTFLTLDDLILPVILPDVMVQRGFSRKHKSALRTRQVVLMFRFNVYCKSSCSELLFPTNIAGVTRVFLAYMLFVTFPFWELVLARVATYRNIMFFKTMLHHQSVNLKTTITMVTLKLLFWLFSGSWPASAPFGSLANVFPLSWLTWTWGIGHKVGVIIILLRTLIWVSGFKKVALLHLKRLDSAVLYFLLGSSPYLRGLRPSGVLGSLPPQLQPRWRISPAPIHWATESHTQAGSVPQLPHRQVGGEEVYPLTFCCVQSCVQQHPSTAPPPL